MKRRRTFYEVIIKRPMDFILSFIAIILLSPVILIVAILVKIKLGGPVIFSQDRPGKNEKIFKLYKFRTMTNRKDAEGNLLPDEVRLTKFGKFLRSTSLDELPGLFNILKGHMSIVGPRPLLVQYLPLYNEVQKKRHLVRPGLTGLAQVNGRNAISWEDKFKYDVKYVERMTFFGDIKIILLTAFKVVRRKDINSNTSATMEVFKGTYNMKDLIIIGAGGHGKVCADIAQRMGKFKTIKFFDEYKTGKVMNIEIVQSKNIEDFINPNTEIFVAIGNNNIRRDKIIQILSLGGDLPILIDPSSSISKSVTLGLGTVVMPHVVINCCASIGIGVILNSSSVVEHDCNIGNYTHISPGVILAGGVNLGENNWVGANSTIIENVHVTDKIIIGANTVVLRDISTQGTYIMPISLLKKIK